MKFTRTRYQNGCLVRKARRKGPDVWALRYREQQADGSSQLKSVIVGNVEALPTKRLAWKACEALRIQMNNESWHPMTVEQLITHYAEKELPTKTPYTQDVYRGYFKVWILPRWGECSLSDVRTVAVEQWLKTLPLAPGTRAKLRNLMHAVYNHAMRWEFAERNPITLVRTSSKRQHIPDVLTADEVRALLAELPEPWRTAVCVAVTTGLRVSELMALKWTDVDFKAGEIHLCRGIIRQRVGQMKTEASRKPIPMDAGLRNVLKQWREKCMYNQPQNWIFASPEMDGKQPYWPTSGMEKHIRPAAKRAGIQKRLGWHMLRHTFGTLVKSQGADVATTQALMRHANASITMDRYVQAVTPAKRKAQRSVARLVLFPRVPSRLTQTAATV